MSAIFGHDGERETSCDEDEQELCAVDAGLGSLP
jgi:hypothetical protein